MSPPILEFDWQKSKSHWLMFSRFIRPQSPDDFTLSDAWKSVLGEPPQDAIKRFIKEGLIVPADLGALISYRYKVSELKDLLRQYGLPTSGRKDEMIQRLVVAAPDIMKKATSGLIVYICSAHGNKLAEEYLFSEKQKRIGVEQQVFKYLKKREFREASVTVASFEADQVFARGLGIDWKHHNPNRDIRILNTIFTNKPKILTRLEDDKLEELRLGAAMMALWGKSEAHQWLPLNFDTGLAFDNDTTARMFLFYAIHKATLEDYRHSNVIKGVEIVAAQDACDACKKLAGIKYAFSEMPELPNEHCTSETGCRCIEIPIMKDDY